MSCEGLCCQCVDDAKAMECCPCCCSCKSATWSFLVGGPKSEGNPDGCDCGGSGGGAMKAEVQYMDPALPPFPGFSNVIRIQSECSIPCTTIEVTVSAEKCVECYWAPDEGGLTASVSGSSECGPVVASINGAGTYYYASKDDAVNVTLTWDEGAPTDPCCVICDNGCTDCHDAGFRYKKYIYKNGRIIINPRFIQQQMKRRNVRKSNYIEAKQRKVDIRRKLF